MDDDLVLSFLYLHQLAKFGWLAGFPFANDFRVRLEHANEFSWQLRQPREHSCVGLSDDLPYPTRHFRQGSCERLKHSLLASTQAFHLSDHALRIIENLSGQAQQPARRPRRSRPRALSD